MSLSVCMWLVLLHINSAKQDEVKTIFRFSSWDFETITKTTAFIDKTLLITSLLRHKDKMLIVAPERSGKSTCLNMVKCFMEISVDFEGKRRNITESNNYILFVDNRLNIFTDNRTLFDEHFGRYPVLWLDYQPLARVSDYDSLLDQLRWIMLNCYERHEYLLDSPRLWSGTDSEDQDLFIKYCQSDGYHLLSEEELKSGFTWLSRLLFKHFDQKVYVLMDEYDAILESASLVKNINKTKIVDFICDMNDKLFRKSEHVGRALIVGKLRHNSTQTFHSDRKLLPDTVTEYNTGRYTVFNKYFGVTPPELDATLNKFFCTARERERAKSQVLLTASATEHNCQVFSLWPVLRYLSQFNTTSALGNEQ